VDLKDDAAGKFFLSKPFVDPQHCKFNEVGSCPLHW
ncbi:uncharacterized protein METZ01_LOCUS476876, partial [marine metagenome]